MLLYNVKKEEMRIGKHKGKTMYYASPIAQDKITTCLLYTSDAADE